MQTKLNKPPTSLHELRFVENIYKTREELAKTFAEFGYIVLDEIPVAKVDCVLFVPKGFPKDRQEVLLKSPI